MAMKETNIAVYDVVKAAQEKDKPITAQDIADATGLTKAQVNGIVTAAFINNGRNFMERVTKVVEVDGEPTTLKFIKLTPAGLAMNPRTWEPAPKEKTAE